VIFAGESQLSSRWDGQGIDQAPLAVACGARYIAAHNIGKMHQYVQEAFHLAKHERGPVVLGVPYDLQKQPADNLPPYVPSSAVAAKTMPLPPHPDQIEQVADMLMAAKVPILVGGRGAAQNGAAGIIEELADHLGAMLATTLPARGLFDRSPHSLHVCGGFAHPEAVPVFDASEIVVAFGASLSTHTLTHGKLRRNATVVQVDPEASGLRHGLKNADIYMRADAKLTAEALLAAVKRRGTPAANIRSADLTRRLREVPDDSTPYSIDDGRIDPRTLFERLEDIIPKDYDVVCGSGHQNYFHVPMRGYDGTKYHIMREFGAIGNSLSYTLGIAAARGHGRIVLFEGDGSLMMHIQELETAQRHGLKFLVVCVNDGAFGSEIHKLRRDGLPDSPAVFGRPNFEGLFKAFGHTGHTITDLSQLDGLIGAYEGVDTACIWDVQVSDKVLSADMRRGLNR
jgi:thiamine pyrophosphate-dependent acetolactate synthase large subunit-like protein